MIYSNKIVTKVKSLLTLYLLSITLASVGVSKKLFVDDDGELGFVEKFEFVRQVGRCK